MPETREPPPEVLCQNCKHFDPTAYPDDPTLGKCRAHAPVVQGLAGRGAIWAAVRPTDWCGEFATK